MSTSIMMRTIIIHPDAYLYHDENDDHPLQVDVVLVDQLAVQQTKDLGAVVQTLIEHLKFTNKNVTA